MGPLLRKLAPSLGRHHSGRVQATPAAAGSRPTPEQLEQLRRLTGPPDNELPTSVAVNAILATPPDLVVALLSATVYSNGLLLNLTLRMRGATEGRAPWLHPGPSAAAGAWMGSQRPDSPDRWLIGVEYSDGRTASTLSSAQRPGVTPQVIDENRPRLLARGGGGGNRVYDSSLWLAPLPPPGPLTVIFTWPAQDVMETATTLDTEAWGPAALHVTQLWAQQPNPPAPALPPVPPIRLQPGGWFERSSQLP